jgi:hypothetical protein
MQWLKKQRLDDERCLDIYFYSSSISMNINECILMSSIFIWFKFETWVASEYHPTERKNPRGHEYQSSFKTAVLPFLF